MATKKAKKPSKKAAVSKSGVQKQQSGLKYDLSKGAVNSSQNIKTLIQDLLVKTEEEQFEYFFEDLFQPFGVASSKIHNQPTV